MKTLSRKNKFTMVLLACLFSCSAWSAITSGHIIEIHVTDSYVSAVIPTVVEPLCQTVDGGFAIDKTHPYFDEIYSLLLSAEFADRSVSVEFNNKAGMSCSIMRVQIK